METKSFVPKQTHPVEGVKWDGTADHAKLIVEWVKENGADAEFVKDSVAVDPHIWITPFVGARKTVALRDYYVVLVAPSAIITVPSGAFEDAYQEVRG